MSPAVAAAAPGSSGRWLERYIITLTRAAQANFWHTTAPQPRAVARAGAFTRASIQVAGRAADGPYTRKRVARPRKMKKPPLSVSAVIITLEPSAGSRS